MWKKGGEKKNKQKKKRRENENEKSKRGPASPTKPARGTPCARCVSMHLISIDPSLPIPRSPPPPSPYSKQQKTPHDYPIVPTSPYTIHPVIITDTYS